jgi:hypothetical protein
MNEPDSLLEKLRDRQIVVDLSSPYVILGTLVDFSEKYLVLDEADVHDLRDTTTTRENYVVDSHRLGIRVNRDRALVRIAEIVSLSALDDVVL